MWLITVFPVQADENPDKMNLGVVGSQISSHNCMCLYHVLYKLSAVLLTSPNTTSS